MRTDLDINIAQVYLTIASLPANPTYLTQQDGFVSRPILPSLQTAIVINTLHNNDNSQALLKQTLKSASLESFLLTSLWDTSNSFVHAAIDFLVDDPNGKELLENVPDYIMTTVGKYDDVMATYESVGEQLREELDQETLINLGGFIKNAFVLIAEEQLGLIRTKTPPYYDLLGRSTLPYLLRWSFLRTENISSSEVPPYSFDNFLDLYRLSTKWGLKEHTSVAMHQIKLAHKKSSKLDDYYDTYNQYRYV